MTANSKDGDALDALATGFPGFDVRVCSTPEVDLGYRLAGRGGAVVLFRG